MLFCTPSDLKIWENLLQSQYWKLGSPRCALLSSEEAGAVLRQTKRNAQLHFSLWPKWNHVGLGVSNLNWAVYVPKVEHILSSVLQTSHTDSCRNCMGVFSTVGCLSPVTRFPSLLHCCNPNKCNEFSRVMIQTRFHHCWQLLQSCDSILLCPWAMKWLFP